MFEIMFEISIWCVFVDKRKLLPSIRVRRVNATPGQHTATAPKKQTNEGKRTSLSSTVHNLPCYNNNSSFRTPCRKSSCPLNQSSHSASLANNFRFASSRSTGLNVSDSADCMDSKTGIKFDIHGVVRANHSYTILNSANEASDSISDSGTYGVDEEQRDDVLKARRTISHVFGVTVKPKSTAQFTRSNTGKQVCPAG